MVLAFIAVALAVATAIWGLISPRALYWTLFAWRYRDPDANEPSDAAYTFTRITSAIALVGLVIVASVLWGFHADEERDEAAEKSTVATCERLISDVQDAWNDPDIEASLREIADQNGLELEVSELRDPDARGLDEPSSPSPAPQPTASPTETPPTAAPAALYELYEDGHLIFSIDTSMSGFDPTCDWLRLYH